MSITLKICEKCGNGFECKAGTEEPCQCQSVRISLNEMQHICEQYNNCLCLPCISKVKADYARVNGFPLES